MKLVLKLLLLCTLTNLIISAYNYKIKFILGGHNDYLIVKADTETCSFECDSLKFNILYVVVTITNKAHHNAVIVIDGKRHLISIFAFEFLRLLLHGTVVRKKQISEYSTLCLVEFRELNKNLDEGKLPEFIDDNVVKLLIEENQLGKEKAPKKKKLK
jgi:hypothetical protein